MRVVDRVRGRFDPPLLGAMLLAAGTVVLAGWVSTAVFDRLPHVEDEVAFLFQARTLAEGEVVAEPPDRPEFFRMPFVIVRGDMWFGKYPPGYPVVLAAGVLAGAPWLVNPLLGGLAVLLVFVAGRRLYDAPTGLIAAALLSVSPFLMLQAGSTMSHVAALVWTLLALVWLEAVVRRASALAAVGCGMALGMLALTRSLTAAGIGLPIGVWLLAMIVHGRRGPRLAGCVVAGALPFVIALLAYNQLTTGSPFKTGYELWWNWDRIGFGKGVSRDGDYTLYDAWDNLKSNAGDLTMYLYGWPARLSIVPPVVAATLAVRRAGIWWRNPTRRPRCAERHANHWDLFLAGSVISLIGIHVIYWTDGQMYGPRYYFEAIGALALLSARALVYLANALGHRLRRAGLSAEHARMLASAAILLLVTSLSLHNASNFSQARFDEFRDWYGINRDGLDTVQEAGIANAVVFVNVRTWSEYAPFFVQSAPSLDAGIIYAIDLGPAANRLLLAEFPGRQAYVFEDGQIRRLLRGR